MICMFYQWRISHVLDSEGVPGRLPWRHMARCPACRDFYEASQSLAAGLRAEAGRDTAPQPSRFRRRVARPVLAMVATVACCLAGAGIVLTVGPDRASHVKAARPRRVPSVSASMLGQTSRCVRSLTDLAREPLLREIRHTSHDVEAAGRALLSCLPLRLARNTAPKPSDDAGRGREEPL